MSSPTDQSSSGSESVHLKQFTVSEPFLTDSGADVVLVSCDNYEFRTRRSILSLASPNFEDVFSLAQPEIIRPQSNPVSGIDPSLCISSSTRQWSVVNSGFPPVHSSETGQVIDILLRYCSPVSIPTIPECQLLISVLDAAIKYEMTFIVTEVEATLQRLGFEQPEVLLFLYGQACEQQQEIKARDYAWECLKLPYPSIMNYAGRCLSASTTALSNLIIYHHAVSNAVANYIKNHRCVERNAKTNWGKCSSCSDRRGSNDREPKWWRDNLVIMVQNIYNEGPISYRILPAIDELGIDQAPYSCWSCAVNLLENWDSIRWHIIDNIKGEAEEVCSLLKLCMYRNLPIN